MDGSSKACKSLRSLVFGQNGEAEQSYLRYRLVVGFLQSCTVSNAANTDALSAAGVEKLLQACLDFLPCLLACNRCQVCGRGS
jgi:hypothetical protein